MHDWHTYLSFLGYVVSLQARSCNKMGLPSIFYKIPPLSFNKSCLQLVFSRVWRYSHWTGECTEWIWNPLFWIQAWIEMELRVDLDMLIAAVCGRHTGHDTLVTLVLEGASLSVDGRRSGNFTDRWRSKAEV